MGRQLLQGNDAIGINHLTMFKVPVGTVVAAGSTIADATPFTTGFTLITGADATKGAQLPAAEAGKMCIVKNGGNAVLKIWPVSADVINGLSASAAISLAANVSAIFVAYDSTTWYTLPLLPS